MLTGQQSGTVGLRLRLMTYLRAPVGAENTERARIDAAAVSAAPAAGDWRAGAMKIGAEDKKKLGVAIGAGVLAIGAAFYLYSELATPGVAPPVAPAPVVVNAPSTTGSSQTGGTGTRTAKNAGNGGCAGSDTEDGTDAGDGVAGVLGERAEHLFGELGAGGDSETDRIGSAEGDCGGSMFPPAPTGPAGPPPIDLKFFGTATLREWEQTGVSAARRRRLYRVARGHRAAPVQGDRGSGELDRGGRHGQQQQADAAVAGELEAFMRLERQGIRDSGEDGFVLLGLIVAIFIILLVLGAAAPRMAKSLQRDRELESMHRANQYVRGIQMYYKKQGSYPASIEQLEKTNNQRFLRQKYIDPLTGKADWRLIHLGEAKTTVKGFFGQPLAGVASAGLGSAAGMNSGFGGASGAPAVSSGASSGSSFGSSSGSSFGSGSGSSFGSGSSGAGSSGSSFGGSSFGGSSGSSFGSSTAGGTGTPGTSGIGGTPGSTGSSGIGSQSASSFGGSGAPFVGVGSAAGGEAIVVVNEQTTHPTWEFLYDPRIEAMRAKTSIFGGGVASMGAGGLGSASGNSSNIGGAPSGSAPGSQTPLTFGSPSTSGSSATPTSPTSPPQTTPQ